MREPRRRVRVRSRQPHARVLAAACVRGESGYLRGEVLGDESALSAGVVRVLDADGHAGLDGGLHRHRVQHLQHVECVRCLVLWCGAWCMMRVVARECMRHVRAWAEDGGWQYLGAEVSELRGLRVADTRDRDRALAHARVRAQDAIHVLSQDALERARLVSKRHGRRVCRARALAWVAYLPDLGLVEAGGRSHHRGRQVGAAASEGGDRALGVLTDEAGDDADSARLDRTHLSGAPGNQRASGARRPLRELARDRDSDLRARTFFLTAGQQSSRIEASPKVEEVVRPRSQLSYCFALTPIWQTAGWAQWGVREGRSGRVASGPGARVPVSPGTGWRRPCGRSCARRRRRSCHACAWTARPAAPRPPVSASTR